MHRLQALRILRQLYTSQGLMTLVILRTINLKVDDLAETLDFLFEEAIQQGELVKCGSCGQYHRPNFDGDCRNDDERFPGWG